MGADILKWEMGYKEFHDQQLQITADKIGCLGVKGLSSQTEMIIYYVKHLSNVGG